MAGVSGGISARTSILRCIRADESARLLRASMVQEPWNGLVDSRSAVSVGAGLLHNVKYIQPKHRIRLPLCKHTSEPRWHYGHPCICRRASLLNQGYKMKRFVRDSGVAAKHHRP